VRFTEDQHPVQALPSHGANQTFCVAILPRRTRRDRSVANAHGPHSAREDTAVCTVIVAHQVGRRRSPGEGLSVKVEAAPSLALLGSHAARITIHRTGSDTAVQGGRRNSAAAARSAGAPSASLDATKSVGSKRGMMSEGAARPLPEALARTMTRRAQCARWSDDRTVLQGTRIEFVPGRALTARGALPLARPRRQRPCRRPAAENSDELAPLCMTQMERGSYNDQVTILRSRRSAIRRLRLLKLEIAPEDDPNPLGLVLDDHDLAVLGLVSERDHAADPKPLAFGSGDLVPDALGGHLSLELGE
jgi:hypothetical protein